MCAECAALARTEITLLRGRGVPIAAAVVLLVLLVPALCLLFADPVWIGVKVRVLFLLSLPIVALGAWLSREIGKPLRVTLHAEGVEMDRLFGPDRWIPLADLEVGFGRIHDRSSGERFAIGELSYSGAARFHRALRVKLARRGVGGVRQRDGERFPRQ